MSQIFQELFDLAVAGGHVQRHQLGITEFDVRHGVQTIHVDASMGSCQTLALEASYDAVAHANHQQSAYRGNVRPLRSLRPMSIELRREVLEDVTAKAKGLNVEWQSGDQVFDRAVYVDTPVTNPDVLGAVLNPEVRRAVLELLAIGFSKVTIDGGDGSVSADLNEFPSREPRAPNRGADSVRAFAQILSNLPPVESAGMMVQRTPLLPVTLILGLVGAGGWVGSPFLVQAERAAHLDGWEIGVAAALGVVAGLVLAFLYGRVVARFARGTSSARNNVLWAQIAAFFGSSFLAFTAVAIALVLSHAK